jgi:hypothetical protein
MQKPVPRLRKLITPPPVMLLDADDSEEENNKLCEDSMKKWIFSPQTENDRIAAVIKILTETDEKNIL